jgi:hypothetical protein
MIHLGLASSSHRDAARRVCCVGAMVLVACLGMWLGAARAEARQPWWHLNTRFAPASVPPSSDATVAVHAINLGDAPAGGPITVSDTFPESLAVTKVEFFTFALSRGQLDLGPEGPLGGFNLCEVAVHHVSCHMPEFLFPLAPFEDIELRIGVHVGAGASAGDLNEAEVSGGEAARVTTDRAVPVSSVPPQFGLEDFSVTPEEEGGAVDSQAGSHPYQFTSALTFNGGSDPRLPLALPKDLHLELPPGLVGNAVAVPKCSDGDFRHVTEGGQSNLCPAESAVGVAMVTFDEDEGLGQASWPVPVFNLVPDKGEPARFGFEIVGSPVIFDTAVRTGGDYGVNVSVSNLSELVSAISSTVTLWGAPGDSSHDESRGWGCIAAEHFGHEAGLPCEPSAQTHPVPFLTMPTTCEGRFNTTVTGDAWPTKAAPAGATFPALTYPLQDRRGRELAITGCNQLGFEPNIHVEPDTQEASTPTGLAVRVDVPQEANENASGLASANIRNTVVTLPAGFALNPASAGGLQACAEPEVGFLGIQGGAQMFTPTLPSVFCPSAAKVGTVKFKVPILAHALEGGIYLASQNANPFGSLVAIYIVANDPESGVLLKLAGNVQLSESGQIMTTFTNIPQAPLEEAEFIFFGGSRAPLATPSHCGEYETTAAFTPWSGAGNVDATSAFKITGGPHGSASCPGTLPFAPTLAAGTTVLKAGAFAPLTTTLVREDGNQDVGSIQLRMPPGFAGMISSITPCGEDQANAGTCGAQSLVGTATVTVGVGDEPLTVSGGQVYVTGPYKGAPFGLSIVTPAKAGPFDLGTVVVRAKLDIDPRTAQVTVTTDAQGQPHAIPNILKGIPLDIRRVSVVVDRPGFAFNPTNCSQLAVTGTITSTEGAQATVSSPFEVANCAKLRFAPKFSVSTSGRPTKANGASLIVKLSYPRAPQGTQANIGKVKVFLPKQLPSRLTTLQKACLAATFEANPAKCPAASIIGHVKATTPVLPVPLVGPVYFVSHGGEAFPSLTMVLQGDNVTVNVVGSTLIRNGVTSTTLNSVPDVPINTFELALPQGRFSALAAFGNLCKSKLVMPTTFVGQNGAELHQNTRIAVTGCKKAKKHGARRGTKAQRRRRRP